MAGSDDRTNQTKPEKPGDETASGKPTNQGVSSPDPVEGADDAPAGNSNSPAG